MLLSPIYFNYKIKNANIVTFMAETYVKVSWVDKLSIEASTIIKINLTALIRIGYLYKYLGDYYGISKNTFY